MKQTPNESSNLQPETTDLPKSGWAKFLGLVGLMSTSSSLLAFALLGSGGVTLAIYAIVAGVFFLFAGHLVQLVTDCRSYLKVLVENRS